MAAAKFRQTDYSSSRGNYLPVFLYKITLVIEI